MVVDIRDNIIKTAEDLFIRFGFKRITMDDIARELAISKKTIYQYFKDKNEIVCSVTLKYLGQEKCQIIELEGKSENVIEYLVKLNKQLRRHVGTINPVAMDDLRRYFPEGWQIYLQFKQDVFLKSIIKILSQGIAEGYFRPDIDPEVLAIMRMEQIQMAFDETLFPRNRFHFTEVQGQFLQHFMAGILTEKGRALLKRYSNSTTTNEFSF